MNWADHNWRGRRVLVTGHTGFKGSWLSIWLKQLGADVAGFALPPNTDPSLFNLVGLEDLIESRLGDVGDLESVRTAVASIRPELVIHMAAQPLVRKSYLDPVETYRTNVMGTVHVLEACRGVDGVRAILVVTSDKCYENQEWVWPYRESDRMGGHDPYSSSKGCAELVVSAWRRSYLNATGAVMLASARAGNVIGGGDWAADRLVPDCVRALAAGEPIRIRNPVAIRPWQHVLEALAGYLALCERLLQGHSDVCDAWNFGPNSEASRPVSDLIGSFLSHWNEPVAWHADPGPHPHEALVLTLDSARAQRHLGWRPRLSFEQAVQLTAEWYAGQRSGRDALALCKQQIQVYSEMLAPV